MNKILSFFLYLFIRKKSVLVFGIGRSGTTALASELSWMLGGYFELSEPLTYSVLEITNSKNNDKVACNFQMSYSFKYLLNFIIFLNPFFSPSIFLKNCDKNIIIPKGNKRKKGVVFKEVHGLLSLHFISEVFHKTPVVIIIRNPLKVVDSIYQANSQANILQNELDYIKDNENFFHFIEKPFKYFQKVLSDDSYSIYVRKALVVFLINEYFHKLKNSKNVSLVRYEDLLDDSDRAFQGISMKLGLHFLRDSKYFTNGSHDFSSNPYSLKRNTQVQIQNNQIYKIISDRDKVIFEKIINKGSLELESKEDMF